jgi:23S rRNA (guanosine2251-2'-O)-methyltransferase
MDTFGFTRKKFLSLAEKNQHRHLISWLSGFYQKLATNRVETTAFNEFCSQYEAILRWINAPCPPRPNQGTRGHIEYISDAIQFHRKASGTPLRDDTLLGQIHLKDRTLPGKPLPDIEYQVALDGLRSLFNVGSIFRTCDAAGVRSVILGNTLGKEDTRVQKTAMGAQEWITQEKTSDLAQTLMGGKKKGFRIIGVETVPGSIPCQEYTWPSKAVVVFGNEEYGISSHVMGTLDDIVHIPMFGRKNSLNVASAVAVILFQAVLSPMLQN